MPTNPFLSRRTLFQAAALVAGATLLPDGIAHAATATTFSPLRPPATPLAVRSPYLTTWLAGDTLPGTWPTFWNGHITALCGIARIDGTPYIFAGNPGLSAGLMTQTAVQLTATRSIYTLTAGGVTLTVTFFSPVDLGNLQRQSVPFSYVTMQAASNDGRSHTVDLHFDASGEWVHGNVTTPITWAQQRTGSTTALTATPASPGVLQEFGDQASWGTLVLAAPNATGLTWQLGQDTVVRGASAAQGVLNNTSDTAQPRAINDRWPVLGLNQNLGTVTPRFPSAQFTVAIGHVRTPALSYLGTQLNPWWTHYWSAWPAMLDWFVADHAAALTSAVALDQRIHDDAANAGGEHYAAICALALRQAAGGTELVDRGGAPWAFLKEISSDGNVSTVDVTYPAFPAYLYLSPAYLQLLLAPLLDYPEHGGWPKVFAQHDLGSSYPNATGHNDGNEEDMPVEESANMLIMSAALVQRLASSDASAFATTHYAILRQWAEYLVANALDPGLQNQTDDFTGFIAHSANLALKGIVGIGAMSVIATAAGNSTDATHYLSVARSYASQDRLRPGRHVEPEVQRFPGPGTRPEPGAHRRRRPGRRLVPVTRGQVRRDPGSPQQLHQGRLGTVDRSLARRSTGGAHHPDRGCLWLRPVHTTTGAVLGLVRGRGRHPEGFRRPSGGRRRVRIARDTGRRRHPMATHPEPELRQGTRGQRHVPGRHHGRHAMVGQRHPRPPVDLDRQW